MKPRIPHLAPYALFATLMLMLGTAGGAVAAKMITGADVKNESLTGRDIKNGSLGAGELSAAARASLTGIKGYEVIKASNVVANTHNSILAASCTAGKRALGGGAYWIDPAAAATDTDGIVPDRPVVSGPLGATGYPTSTDVSGWVSKATNNSGASLELRVYVICAKVG